MKKILSVILTFAIAAVCLTGCSDNRKPDADHPVTLTMWHVYGSQTKSPLNDAIDRFNDTVGRENGVTVNVVSVTSSSAIDKALSASANGEPGAEDLPDLFTAYPRVAEIVRGDTLLCWNDYFSEEDLSVFRDELISEGYFGDKLLMLPVAKSSEALFLNKTLFDRFSAETGVSTDTLKTFEGFFETANIYYDWSDGQNFTQINDFYNYAYVGMKANGGEFINDGKLNLNDEAFEKVWYPLSKAAIYGGICLDDGYAASRWKTVEIISNIDSTADILYQPEMVFYPDNTTENIISVSLPYPTFTADHPAAVHRGGGLFAVKSEDDRKNYGAYIFAKWITEKENNLRFVTSTGYLPVTDEAFTELFANTGIAETESYKKLYDMMNGMMDRFRLYSLPVYDNASDIQSDFEQNVKLVLRSAHNQYMERTAKGEDKDVVLDEHNGIYSGQFSSNRYNAENALSIKSKNGSMLFDFGSEKCVGLTKEIVLGSETFSIAVMLPKTQYEGFLRKGQIQILLIFLIAAVLAAVCCVFMSKKYVSPILKKIEQVKSKEDYGEQLRIREIDDLFAFLEEKDNDYEQQLDDLENAKRFAEEEARRAKEEYEKAAEKYELAKSEIDRLAEKHKEEIVPEEYQFFVENLSMLTPAEHRIYELYLSGKTAKQIAEILHITENTLKYHNKNIYSKLGISSRKQLLRFAALKHHRDGKEDWM